MRGTDIVSMWHCSVDVAYSRLSDWTRLHWAHAVDKSIFCREGW